MEKRIYEQLKDIRTRVSTGQTTTFSERNWLNMQLKTQAKKKKFPYTK